MINSAGKVNYRIKLDSLKASSKMAGKKGKEFLGGKTERDLKAPIKTMPKMGRDECIMRKM